MPSKDQKTLACWLDMKLQINREGPRACREGSEGVLDLGYRQRGLSVRRVTTSGGASPVPHLACHWLRLQPLNSSGCFSVVVVATRHLDTHVTQTQTSFCLPHGRSDLTQASSWGGWVPYRSLYVVGVCSSTPTRFIKEGDGEEAKGGVDKQRR